MAQLGCRVEVELELERLRFKATADRSSAFAIDCTGDWSEAAADATAVTAAASATAAGDLARLLETIDPVELTITVAVLGVPGVSRWVRTLAAATAEHRRRGWLHFAQLIGRPGPERVRIVVMNAGDSAIVARGVSIHGPAIWPDAGTYASTAGAAARAELAEVPEPSALCPVAGDGNLKPIEDVLLSTAGALAWLWLSDRATVAGASVEIGFDGVRRLDFSLTDSPTNAALDCVNLWEWCVEGGQPARRLSASQAVTLHVEARGDLYDHVLEIRNTAELLFSVSQSGLVREALAARRAGFEAAASAARGAADRARTIARATVDRVIVGIGAGFGVLLANKSALIGRPVAFALYAVAIGIAGGSGVIALVIELPAALTAVEDFEADLPTTGDVLTTSDQQAILGLRSLGSSRTEIRRARRVSALVVAIGMSTLVAAGFYTAGVSGDAKANPAATTTTTGPSTTTAGPATTPQPKP